jgi:hypothetical protein
MAFGLKSGSCSRFSTWFCTVIISRLATSSLGSRTPNTMGIAGRDDLQHVVGEAVLVVGGDALLEPVPEAADHGAGRRRQARARRQALAAELLGPGQIATDDLGRHANDERLGATLPAAANAGSA